MLKRLIGLGISLSILISGIPVSYASDYMPIAEKGITKIASGNYFLYTGEAPSVVTLLGKEFISCNSGKKLSYKIDVEADGIYRLKADAGTTQDIKVDFYVDNELVLNGRVPKTGGFYTFIPQAIGLIYLTEGTHVFTVDVVSEGGIYFAGVEFDLYDINGKNGAYKTPVLPDVVEAEKFNIAGIEAYIGDDGKTVDGNYLLNSEIDVYEDKNGGYYIHLTDNKFAQYTLSVEQEGAYAVKVASPQSGTIDLKFDDYTYPIRSRLYNEYKENEVATVYLTEGEHKLRISAGEFDREVAVDYISFEKRKSGEYIDLEVLNDGIVQDKETEIDSSEHPIYKELWISEKGSDNNNGTEESPFRTLTRAKEEVAKINDAMTGDIIVNIEPGTYKLNETEKFDKSHSGKNGYDVIYRGTDKNNPSLITGGVEVTDWKKHNDVIWKAPLDVDMEVRNFYINDFSAVRARSKYGYVSGEFYDDPKTEYINDGFYVDRKNFPNNFKKPSDLELVWFTTWASQRTAVKDLVYDVDDEHHLFKMVQPSFYICTIPQPGTPCSIEPNYQFYIENAMELLDQPGEFYYSNDDKMIYYYPLAEEDMTKASTYVAETEFLMDIRGNEWNDRIENIAFKNLAFKHGAYNEPSELGAYTVQANSKRQMKLSETGGTLSMHMPAQITVNDARNIRFNDCIFACLGSEGINMTDGVSDCEITGCIIKDISAGGITVGTNQHNKDNQNNPTMKMCENILIKNNVFTRVGTEFIDSIPVTVFYERNIDILHNDISDTPYSGLSIGWGWGSASADPPYWGFNDISYNRVGDTMKTLHDGGNIYALGRQRGTVLSYNYMYPSHNGFNGIYNDTGSGLMELHHNVVDASPKAVWWFNGPANKEKMYVHNNFSNAPANKYSKGHPDNAEVIVEDHTVLTEGSWPEEALDIKENAGLEPEYRHLLDKAKKPIERRLNRSENLPRGSYMSADRKTWIQAEDFIKGEMGVAFNAVGSSSVELQSSFVAGGGDMIQKTFDGEWVTYNFDIPVDGDYYIEIMAGHGYNDATFSGCSMYIDGELVVDNYRIPKTSWSHLEAFRVKEMHFKKGTYHLKYEWKGEGSYLDSFRVVEKSFADRPVSNENEPEFDEGIIVYEDAVYEDNSFDDIIGHWAEKDILTLASMDVIKGVGDRTFAPEMALTGRQALLLTFRALGIEHTEDNIAEEAKALSVIPWDADIDKMISRQEFCDIIIKTYSDLGLELKEGSLTQNYLDMDKVDDIYAASVTDALKLGLIRGDENAYIHPRKSLTRAEAATIILRLKALSRK